MSLHADAQMDSVRPMTAFSNDVVPKGGNGYNEITNVAFPVLWGKSTNYLDNLLFVKGFEKGWDAARSELTINDYVSFRYCSSYTLDRELKSILPDDLSGDLRFVLKKGLGIRDITAPTFLVVDNVWSKDKIAILQNHFNNLYFDNWHANVEVVDNEWNNQISFLGQALREWFSAAITGFSIR